MTCPDVVLGTPLRDSLAEQLGLEFARACVLLAEARDRRRRKDTPEHRATVARLQVAIDELLDLYLETGGPAGPGAGLPT